MLVLCAIVQEFCFFEWLSDTMSMFKTFLLFLNRTVNKQSGEWWEEVCQYMANDRNVYYIKKKVSSGLFPFFIPPI